MFRRLIKKKKAPKPKAQKPKTEAPIKKPVETTVEEPMGSFIQTVSSKRLTAEGWNRRKIKN